MLKGLQAYHNINWHAYFRNGERIRRYSLAENEELAMANGSLFLFREVNKRWVIVRVWEKDGTPLTMYKVPVKVI